MPWARHSLPRRDAPLVPKCRLAGEAHAFRRVGGFWPAQKKNRRQGLPSSSNKSIIACAAKAVIAEKPFKSKGWRLGSSLVSRSRLHRKGPSRPFFRFGIVWKSHGSNAAPLTRHGRHSCRQSALGYHRYRCHLDRKSVV